MYSKTAGLLCWSCVAGVAGSLRISSVSRFALHATFRWLDARRDRPRIGATPTTRPAPLAIRLLTRRLRTAVRAVRVALAFLDFLAHRRRTPCLGDRIGHRLGDQVHRTNRVV